MARRKLPRALAASVSAVALAPSEILFDQTNNVVRVGDGSALGGKVLMNGVLSGGVTVPPLSRPYFNPTQVGGLFGEDDGISRTAQVEKYSFTGNRNGKAWIGRTILMSDGATSPASGPAEASYGLSIYGDRPNWNTSSITGEMDGLNITLRQANGDSCAILSNVFGRVGFFAFLECEAGSMDAAGNKIKAINAQIASVNSRDGGEYGLVLQTTAGEDLSAGIRVATKPGTSWRRYAEYIDADGQYVFSVDGPTGATFTRTIAPFVQYAGNVGAPGLEYDVAFLRAVRFTPRNFASLPSPVGNAGLTARIDDAADPITTFNQIVTSGGGANTAMLSSDGANWRAISS